MPDMTQAHTLPESCIVWWCAWCESYTLERESDGRCPEGCDTYKLRHAKQRRRRAYICADCDPEEHMYLTKWQFFWAHRGMHD